MNTCRKVRPVSSLHMLLGACALAGLTLTCFSVTCQAGPKEEPFYHQLIDLKDRDGYQPTRSFTIVTDAEHGNQLVAEDDPDLRFNLMWMDRYQPGYKERKGGAAFGQIFRSYAKSLYKSYRANHNGDNNLLPDGEGRGSVGYTTDVDYDLRISGDEVKVGFKYSY